MIKQMNLDHVQWPPGVSAAAAQEAHQLLFLHLDFCMK